VLFFVSAIFVTYYKTRSLQPLVSTHNNMWRTPFGVWVAGVGMTKVNVIWIFLFFDIKMYKEINYLPSKTDFNIIIYIYYFFSNR